MGLLFSLTLLKFGPKYCFFQSLNSEMNTKYLSLNRRETIGHGGRKIFQAVVKPEQVKVAATKSGVHTDDFYKVAKYVFEPRYIAKNGFNGVVTIGETFTSRYL